MFCCPSLRDSQNSLIRLWHRYAHCAAVYDNKMYIWGGQRDCNSERYFNDMHCFDFKTHVWREVKQHGSIPEPRFAGRPARPVSAMTQRHVALMQPCTARQVLCQGCRLGKTHADVRRS